MGCLDNALRIVSELSLVIPLRPWVQSMRSQEILLGSSIIGLPSEDRVRAGTSAVQDFWCPPPYLELNGP